MWTPILIIIALPLLVGLGFIFYLYGLVPGTYRYYLRGLGHRNRRVRINAAKRLGKIKNPEAVGPLVRCLKLADPNIRKAAIEALGSIGRPSIEALCQTFLQQDEALRFSAVEALLAIDPQVSIDPLCKRLATAPAFIRRYVAEVLVRIGPDAIDSLLCCASELGRFTSSENKEEERAVHEQFVQVLSRIGTPNPDLLYQAPATSERQKLYLAEALAQLGDERAAQLLVNALDNKQQAIRSSALQALQEMGEATIPYLLEVLRGKNEQAKVGVLETLVAMGGASYRALFELIECDDPKVQLQAAIALGRMGRVRSLISVLWPNNHIAVAYIIENSSKIKIDALGSLASFRKAIEQALLHGRTFKKYRALYYLQSLVIALHPEAVSRSDDPRLGRILTYSGMSNIENGGFLRLTHLHPYARQLLERGRQAVISTAVTDTAAKETTKK
ncbi:MAG: HEAT repeat domain-containing protein [Cyanobacteria bacterium NC_groundwater_1444_Ag_S-0.65um_54_12]|nr:HEAT repeat domain-containing protein [Cyanobacteria bacterium NC_groundwater_1444_Ag_S-0.65um_54_12]